MCVPCKFFSNFGLTTQLVLGVVAGSCLLLKHFREKPRRPWGVLGFDISKQALGMAVAHLCNLALAMLLTVRTADPCVWYFINVVFDTTVGTALNCWLLHRLVKYVRNKQWSDLDSGNYGQPPQWRPWIMQTTSWVSICILAKLLLAVALVILRNWLPHVGAFMLLPFCRLARLKLVVVMMVTPTVLNTIQFLVQDTMLKTSTGHFYSIVSTEEGGVIVHDQDDDDWRKEEEDDAHDNDFCD